MTDENFDSSNQEIKDGEQVDRDEIKNDIETKETAKEPKSVSFNSDVHVKRFGKPRETRSSSSEYQKPIRREPFTHLSEKELIEEANKVRAQAESVSCTIDQSPEKFFSLPHRRKGKPELEKLGRRNSDEGSESKSNLGRSSSDVSHRKKKERTSLSTLFRKAQRNKSPEVSVVVGTKPVVKVKRSKSDVSDLKSNTKLNIHPKPIRKRSGSESEEFLKSLRNKKVQLSPIIESSPREDYFKKTSPLEIYQQENLNKLESVNKPEIVGYERKVNPIAKPPRYKSPENEPKPPLRTKRGKSLEKEKSPPTSDSLETKFKKQLVVDEVDSTKVKDLNPIEVKDRIKESIKKIRENIYGSKDMIHSSQQPPDKPPLTRGNTVGHIVRKLKEDQKSPSPVSSLLNSHLSTNTNQPFSYTKPSVSPDPNMFARTTSPDRIPSPVNKMSDRGIVYAHVVRDQGDKKYFGNPKQTVHKTYSPTREKFGNFSDEDEGLGYEEKYKYSTKPTYEYKSNDNSLNSNSNTYKLADPPIKPNFREFKLTSFEDYEPTYANGFARKDYSHDYTNRVEVSQDFIDTKYRGRGDGMDYKKKPVVEDDNTKLDLNFNELTHRRKLLESRLNARMLDMERNDTGGTITRYLTESDPIYEAQKKMKATEKYVNETAKYYHNTLEKDGYVESSIVEDYDKYDSDNNRIKHSQESRSYEKKPTGEVDKYRYIDTFDRKFKGNTHFPPEPEYEPPSLETTVGKPILSPDEYTEKKYKIKSKYVTNQDVYHTSVKKKSDFGKRKGHYASNPEIANDDIDYHSKKTYDSRNPEFNSLRREKYRDKYKHNVVQRHDSGDSRDYYREEDSPRRYEPDRLVDSGIENDFRKTSSRDLQHSKYKNESDDDARNSSMFIANEKRHTEDNLYPSEQVYANGGYMARFQDKTDKNFELRERSADDGSHFDPKRDRYETSPIRIGDKISAKPPKATKKLTGLERVKQLFSRDSSKKSKKETEEVQPKPRTRVLKSPEHLVDDEYRRYRDPEPSDEERRNFRELKSSREDLERYRPDPRDSDLEKHGDEFERHRTNRHVKERHYREERQERRHYESSDRDSDHRRSDLESDRGRKARSKTAEKMDSPALAERYRERRRLATPSPTPSPPRPQPSPTLQTSGSWFKSLDRLSRKKTSKAEKDSGTATEDESVTKKNWSKTSKPNSPAKNLRFFGDTDHDSDANSKQDITKNRTRNTHSLLRKTMSNSSNGADEIDFKHSYKTEREERPKQYYKRNLHNISEVHSASENESNLGRRIDMKPPIDRRSRSQSNSKTLKGSRNDVRKGSRDDLREERGSSSELRSSKQDLSRDKKLRRRTPGTNSGESSTEGESSQHSQKSVVFLHATTVGEIPDPGVLARNRSRDDVSSVNSSNLQIRTTQKTFSLFAPWTPRHYNDPYDVHYAQKPRKSKSRDTYTKSDRPGTLQKNKSYSHTTLHNRTPNNRLTSSNTSLYRKPERKDYSSSTLNTRSRSKKSQSNEVLNSDSDKERISRSLSMPKDKNKKAGWFNLSNKNKKHEINTRLR